MLSSIYSIFSKTQNEPIINLINYKIEERCLVPEQKQRKFTYSNEDLMDLYDIFIDYKNNHYRGPNGWNLKGDNINDDISILRKLNIELPIDQIKTIYDKYKVIQLRYFKSHGLVICCGNSPLQYKFDDDYIKYHQHKGYDSIDNSIYINPTVVADIGNKNTDRFFKDNNLLFDFILGEGTAYFDLYQPTTRVNEIIPFINTILSETGTLRCDNSTFIGIYPESFNVQLIPTHIPEFSVNNEIYGKFLELYNKIKDLKSIRPALIITDDELNKIILDLGDKLKELFLKRTEQCKFKHISYSDTKCEVLLRQCHFSGRNSDNSLVFNIGDKVEFTR